VTPEQFRHLSLSEEGRQISCFFAASTKNFVLHRRQGTNFGSSSYALRLTDLAVPPVLIQFSLSSCSHPSPFGCEPYSVATCRHCSTTLRMRDQFRLRQIIPLPISLHTAFKRISHRTLPLVGPSRLFGIRGKEHHPFCFTDQLRCHSQSGYSPATFNGWLQPAPLRAMLKLDVHQDI